MSNRLWDAIDLNHYAEDQRYKFLTASVVPRPIALVTSMGRRGVVNAAPFSQFVIICITPPLLGIVVHHVANIEKDTLSNIRDSAEFVINSVSETMAQQVQQCAEFYPRDISEAEQVGFHLIASKLVRTPRIAESVV